MLKNIILIVILYLSTYGLGLAQSETLREGSANPLLYAVAWKQTAAEYRALFHQGFNVARFHLAEAIATHKPENKPLAVITDVDDTISRNLSARERINRQMARPPPCRQLASMPQMTV